MKVPDNSPQEAASQSADASRPADRPELANPSELASPSKPGGEPHATGQHQAAGQAQGERQPEAADQPEGTAEPELASELEGASSESAGFANTVADQLPPSRSLAEAISRLGLEIAGDKIAKLDEYCRRLWELNQHINLTRHTTYDLFARRDLLDTYELAKFIEAGEEVLDVGTGGGVPGIPLAILRPDVKVSLCDSVAKKARAADTLVSQLKLPIYVHSLRVQDVLEEHTFDTLVTRAAGSITQLCNWLNDYWHCFNRLLAIKGPRWVEERKEARHRGVLHGTVLRRIHGYRMPGTKSESAILQLHRPRPGSAS